MRLDKQTNIYGIIYAISSNYIRTYVLLLTLFRAMLSLQTNSCIGQRS